MFRPNEGNPDIEQKDGLLCDCATDRSERPSPDIASGKQGPCLHLIAKRSPAWSQTLRPADLS
jgi:hypothetical protein